MTNKVLENLHKVYLEMREDWEETGTDNARNYSLAESVGKAIS